MPAQMDVNALKSAGLQMIGTAVMGGDNVEYWTRDGLPWPKSGCLCDHKHSEICDKRSNEKMFTLV